MGCAGRHNPFFCCPRCERDGVACVASEVVLPVGHHQNLAGGLLRSTPRLNADFSRREKIYLSSRPPV